MADYITPLYPAFTVGTNDDEFDDNNFSGWTAVNSGSQIPTIIETNHVASIAHPGAGGSAYLWAYVKSYTMQVNDYIEMAFRLGGISQAYNRAGLILADGNTWNAGSQAIFGASTFQNFFNYSSYTNYNTDGGGATYTTPLSSFGMPTSFLRFVYEGSNHFRGYISPNGISWIDSTGQITRTLTPTYIGFFLTPYGGAAPIILSMHYFRQSA
jgi:hypothetical protein